MSTYIEDLELTDESVLPDESKPTVGNLIRKCKQKIKMANTLISFAGIGSGFQYQIFNTHFEFVISGFQFVKNRKIVHTKDDRDVRTKKWRTKTARSI